VTDRLLSRADVPRVLELAHVAGWTQTESDILRMLEYAPSGCFGAELPADPTWPGGLGAIAMGFPHGPELGWVAMVLTHPDLRGRGLGSLLTERAVEYLRSLGTHWIKLDASHLGRPIYERMGFGVEFTMERRLRPSAPLPKPMHAALPPVEEGAPIPLELDRQGFGTDRSRLLAMLCGVDGARMAVAAEGRGYALLRTSRRGLQLGPLVAADAHAAEALLRWGIIEAGQATVQWDLMRENDAARALAETYGFAIDRILHRMVLQGVPDPPPFEGRAELVYSIAGFDFG
jgi:GNAT superfamily N-acetyltransferase